MKSLFRKLLLLVFACLICFLMAEAFVRFTGVVPPHGYPKGLFVPDPYTEFRMSDSFPPSRFSKQEFETTVFTNSDGFRDRERTREKPEGSLRILVVGDSFVWGAYGVDANDTFTAVTERNLNTRIPERDIEVINIGVVGWGTDNALAFLQSRWQRYQPDGVVISFCTANDFFDNLRTGEYSVVDGYLVETDSIGKDSLLRTIRNWAVRTFRVAVLAERVIFQLEFLQPILQQQEALRFHGKDQTEQLFNLDSPEHSAIIAPTKHLLGEVAELCRNNQVPLMLMPIPSSMQVTPDANKGSGVPDHRLDTPDRILEDLCAGFGIQFVPTLPELRKAALKEPLYWRLNPHFNHAGNQAVANILTRHLEAVYVN